MFKYTLFHVKLRIQKWAFECWLMRVN
uniref:Uncharacterized protein n=1 Tax=Anguilla anguilla TaxID=7936 RepID=A0A0E9W2I0_ANGAN